MGFSANMLWLAESEFGKRDEARPGLCMSQWLQFCLDNFATVDEAVTKNKGQMPHHANSGGMDVRTLRDRGHHHCTVWLAIVIDVQIPLVLDSPQVGEIAQSSQKSGHRGHSGTTVSLE